MAADEPLNSHPEHLAPSKLGTKEYWDDLYTAEITNHASNPADIGTVWFDDSDAEAKMVAFLDRHESRPPPVPGLPPLRRHAASFLDLGTGNGSLLHALRRAGWGGRCLGVDYSAGAVELARRVAEAGVGVVARDGDGDEDEDEDGDGEGGRGGEDDGDEVGNSGGAQQQGASQTTTPPRRRQRPRPSTAPLSFLQWDVLAGALDGGALQAGTWDVLLDKGTFDAACLSADEVVVADDGDEDEDDGDDSTSSSTRGRRRRRRRACESYRSRVLRLLRPGDGGLFLITSCNWTEAELRAWFEGGGGGEGVGAARLEFVDQVAYRTFSFGGVEGQTISTVCFVKRESSLRGCESE